MKAKDRKAIVIFVGAGALAIGLIVLQAVLTKKNAFDKVTLCPIGPTAQHSIVLLDKSDRWDDNDIDRVDNFLSRVNSSVPARARLTIVEISGNGRGTTDVSTVFDKCNPGTGQQCNLLYQNCDRIRRTYDKSFKTVLDSVVKELRMPGESSSSPIFSTMVQMLDSSDAGLIDLHIVSDLMENGMRFRFYDEVPLAEDIVAQFPLPKLGALHAHVHVIQRQRHSHDFDTAVRDVWSAYFDTQGYQLRTSRLIIAE